MVCLNKRGRWSGQEQLPRLQRLKSMEDTQQKTRIARIATVFIPKAFSIIVHGDGALPQNFNPPWRPMAFPKPPEASFGRRNDLRPISHSLFNQSEYPSFDAA